MKEDELRLMSYNILADHLIKRDQLYYPFELKYFEDKKKRITSIFNKDILPLNPDFLLLQEHEDGDDHLLGILSQNNYKVNIF